MTDGSVTHWIEQAGEGDELAAQALWNRYFERLLRICRKKLQGHSRRGEDEEDVALSAVDCALRGIRDGRYPQVSDRDDLWRLLVHIAAGKAIDRVRHQACRKRGGGRVVGESHLAIGPDGSATALQQIIGDEPTPEFAAMVAEECQQRLNSLPEPMLRQLAMLKLEGFTNREISEALGCSERSVERKLHRIRKEWADTREIP